jgi:uncharacterized protein YjbI with pentapeptide repeats
MLKRIEFIAHTHIELAALVQTVQHASLRIAAIREQGGALLFQLETPAALRLQAQLRSTRSAPPDGENQYLSDWLTQARANQGQANQGQTNQTPATQVDSAAVTLATAAPVSSGTQLTRSFRGQDLRAQRFTGQDLRGADFSDTDLRGADFSGANLQGALFHRAQLGVVPGWWAAFAVASCERVANWGWHYIERNLCSLGTRFRAADLRGADFSGAHIGMVNFHAANLAHCGWRGANWHGPVWVSDSRLRNPQLIALLCQGSRRDANFAGQDLSELDCSWLDLSGFDLRGARLDGANLSHARLTAADLHDASMNAATRFAEVDCDYIIWPGVAGGRWPPAPEVLRQGDFARWFQVLPTGIAFIARGIGQLQAGLTVLQDMQLRLQQIKLITVETAVETAVELESEAVFHLEIAPQPEQWPSETWARLCQQVWIRMQTVPAQPPQAWMALFGRQ